MKKTNAVRILDAKKIAYDLVEYSYDTEDLSVQKIALENKLPLEKVYKTLVAKGDKTGVQVAVIQGDRSLDLKRFAKASGNKKMAMVLVKDLERLTGYIRGGCAPIGMKKNFPVFIDESATNLDSIYVNAGIKGILMQLNPQDLLKAANAIFAPISKTLDEA